MAAFAGCKSPQGMERIPGHRTPKVAEPPAQPPITSTTPEIPTNTPTMYPLANSDSYSNYIAKPEVFASDTVHFAYDSSAVKNSEKSKAEAVAQFLQANAMDAVRIEGHCDERGTDEYNRSLGERRALALREELIHLGIDPAHILTISYGKDRPVDTGHTEEAHAKNRRGEFILLVPPPK